MATPSNRDGSGPARSLHAPAGQSVAFVELFFDLVFVFAVTQVTTVTAEHLDPRGVGRAVLIFWLIWWAWTQFTWTLNPADTRHIAVQVVTLVATAAAFVMAASVSLAFGDGALWFAVPYVVVRVLGLGLQVRIATTAEASGHPDAPRYPRQVMGWAAMSCLGLAAVLAGAFVDTPIYARHTLPAGARIDGPAVIEEFGSTTVVFPGQTLTVDPHGIMIVRKRAGAQ